MPPKRPRRALLKQELVELCEGDHIKALILERLLYKSRMVEEYAEMRELSGNGKEISQEIDEASRGWITASAASLTKELLLGSSQKTTRRKLVELVRSEYIIENTAYDGWRGASSYKVNIEFLQMQLHALGYVLDGYGLPSTEIIMNNQAPDYDPDKEWGSIPSASANMVVQSRLPGIEEMNAWVSGQKLLASAPSHIAITSWLLWKHGGFSPYGNKKAWYSACSGLWEAAGCNEHTLNEAIETGQSVRISRGLTMSGPRSFITFALDAKARRTLQGRAVDASGESRKDASAGRLNGQTVSTTDTGKQVIEIGRRHGK